MNGCTPSMDGPLNSDNALNRHSTQYHLSSVFWIAPTLGCCAAGRMLFLLSLFDQPLSALNLSSLFPLSSLFSCLILVVIPALFWSFPSLSFRCLSLCLSKPMIIQRLESTTQNECPQLSGPSRAACFGAWPAWQIPSHQPGAPGRGRQRWLVVKDRRNSNTVCSNS